MENGIYRHIVEKGNFIYIYGKIISNKIGEIEDVNIIELNKRLVGKLGIAKERIINKSLFDLFLCKDKWIEIIKKATENQCYNDTLYIKNLNEWLNIEIEMVNKSEFYIIMEEAYKLDEFTKKLLEVFPAGIWYKDKNGRYIVSSKTMLSNDRVKDKHIDIKGRTDLDIQKSKKVAGKVMEHDLKLIENMYSVEHNNIISNNNIHISQKHCVKSTKGESIGTLGFYLDITAHENLKEDYRKYKKLSDLLLQSIPDILVYKNIEGKYEYCNKSFLDYLGLDNDKDVIGKYDFEVYYHDEFEQDFIPVTDKIVIENKQALRYTTNPINKGKRYYFDIIKTPYLNDQGEVIGITAMIRDITKLVLTKNKLKENEEQLNVILNGINDVIILSDKDGIIYVNKAFENVFGIKREDYLKNSKILRELFTEEYKEILGEYEHDKDYNIDININTRDGKNKWIWYKGYLLDNTNKAGKKITIIRDITAKKEYDMELENLKAEFFANITHELRTPLNLIFSSLQLIDLKRGAYENNLDNYIRYIDIIKQNSLRLLKLVNNLIDSTKIDSGYLNCNYENTDIVSFLEKVFNSIEGYAKSKNIQLIFDTNIEEKIISLDMDKIERIILNILSNAIKFNKVNGKIYLSMKVNSNFTEISIKDTGIGIPKNKIESVFDRFIQVNNRMTKISEGSGIGLSISKSLIEMLGGNIVLKSELGEGSEFIITIPNRINDDKQIVTNKSDEYNSFVKKCEIEFSDIYC